MRLRCVQNIGTDHAEGERLFVMFHGFGNDESEMVRILDAIYAGSNRAPNYLSFRATYPRPYMGGNYWYPDGCGVAERRRECSRVGDAVVSMLDSPLYRGMRKTLVGFSQGGYLSYRLTVERPEAFDEAVLLSPSFKGECSATPDVSRTRYVLAYGGLDRTIPAEDQRTAREKLSATHGFVDLNYPDMGHAICDQEIADLREFLNVRPI
ncbi:alpha/beta hydrolase [Bifidobacterium eulemuris]|uniref:Dienelactone hydrolase family protein n=1 Tax=Bifidobacterium eulemuris TaxID=1765219 RepID=A0A261GCQ3_9BIFI|nr:dienelactone hydrolase family protein [Bifidobacterium eulemuris]OZG69208.1 phospholipase/carboxylesterase [Bifidobacterium eulemuris]QOL31282.1 dienelactone hydrolase family protein [Bifidobacterium eulemuris]